MIFAKKLFLSSVFAVGAFGLIACGSDSKSSSEPDPNNPDNPIVVPTQQDANITVSSDLSSRLSGEDNMRFKGRFGLDITVDTAETRDQILFTGITYTVGKGTDPNNLLPVNVTITSNQILFPSPNDIDLNSMNSAGVMINMKDPGFTGCGAYSLIVTVTASDDPIGAPAKFSNTVTIPFERDSLLYCYVEEQNPEPEPQVNEIPMTTCTVDLSTDINPGLSLATCTAVPAASAATADIIFAKAGTKSEPEIAASSGSGTVFAPISNGDLPPYADDYEVDIWPEEQNDGRTVAYVSDFMFTTTGPTLSSMVENSSQIYVAMTPAYNAATGAGFYAFAITNYTEGNNGNFNFTVKLYKVQ